MYRLGIDIGSTTVKLAALDDKGGIVYSVYRRHKSNIAQTVKEVITEAFSAMGDVEVKAAVTGSGGITVAGKLGLPFVQEVVCGRNAIKTFLGDIDVAIELGGEDSKITYLSGNTEQRMNSICAGGTGAFIDQMANLLDTDAAGLDELSKGYTKLYPIASRCGVFAKTDIQALINQGADRADIAMSVFQSVVNQTISNLACGRPIKGNVAFLGGPFRFLPSLKDRFIATLGDSCQYFLPENAEIFVAMGAAVSCGEAAAIKLSELIKRFEDLRDYNEGTGIMEPLFTSAQEYEEFCERHNIDILKYGELEGYEGELYIGIDAGSTTSKIVVTGADGTILYTDYKPNDGQPLDKVREFLSDIYKKKNPAARIVSSGITGYGEEYIKAALKIDYGEVETIAHYTAAKFFLPEVDFILDIGGQDMKALKIKDGVIDSVLVNEACSSGCGSFLSTFAAGLSMTPAEFSKEALFADRPVDLGSRCTVFMNSKVKQAQKQGSSVGDIAAGLMYSVIKNALQKVIKVRDPKQLGRNIVVQGGTFYGDAILRAFEKIAGVEAVRPPVAGLMGALGMALICKKRAAEQHRTASSMLDLQGLEDFSVTTKSARCGRCSNNCLLNIHIFKNGERYITGNRCERGVSATAEKSSLPNLYEYKLKRLFGYKPLENAPRGEVGLPRVLNMYENYPFWFTFFTEMGYRVVLSDESCREIYEKGIATISSETACYPAKLTHGHIENLAEKGVKFIFYPCTFYEKKRFKSAGNHLNCPVVAGYPEVIKNNVDVLKEKGITYKNPFISLDNEKVLVKRLSEELQLPRHEVAEAVKKASAEMERYRSDVMEEGRRAMEYLDKNGKTGIVLCGRPYHIDPEINHGIPELITSMGFAVLSEDAVAVEGDYKLRVLDQWAYHSRLYRAAEVVGRTPSLQLVQLNSFGCGLDSVTSDQVSEILDRYGKIYTLIKIDEVSNLGAVKIRLRSLMEALKEKHVSNELKPPLYKLNPFLKPMRKTHTILVPQMAPDHFELLQSAMRSEGYNFEFLKKVDRDVINEGLKYVNNDSCYPSITVVGQMIEALKSGRYDLNNVSVMMTQTGGACRASNYIGYIRKALKEAGFPDVPAIAISIQGIETSPGIKITYSVIKKAVLSILLGDLLMRLSNAVRPYEVVSGTTDSLKAAWIKRLRVFTAKPKMSLYKDFVSQIVSDFENVAVHEDMVKPKVGIVGEILIKYLPEANNHLQKVLESEGAEVIIPDLTDFLMYCFRNPTYKNKLLGKSAAAAIGGNIGVAFIEHYRKPIRAALKNSRFEGPLHIKTIEEYATQISSLGHQYGEGWLLAGEMIELINSGAPNIVCIQPFGCLPNHITGKGVMKKIRESYRYANVVAIDYDPGASEVNQINRIKLMMSSARENMEKMLAEKKQPEKIGAGKAAMLPTGAKAERPQLQKQPEKTGTKG